MMRIIMQSFPNACPQEVLEYVSGPIPFGGGEVLVR